MKIAVFSDTHGLTGHVLKHVGAMESFQAVIHAGDHYHDAAKMASELKLPCYAVLGNCDGLDQGPNELVICLDGIKIFICHGHLFGVKTSLDALVYRALEIEANVVVFGHTHLALNVWEEKLLLFNPGSTLPTANSPASFGILTIDQGTARGEIITL